MKKNLIIFLAILFVSLSAHAEYTDAQRLKDMQIMESAVSKIQKGLLYNKAEVVELGVNQLQDVIKGVQAPKKKDEVPGMTDQYSAKYTKKLSDKMISFSEKIKEDIKAGHKHSAAKNYVNVLNQCISCHNKVRPGK
jgi:cytochrome c556